MSGESHPLKTSAEVTTRVGRYEILGEIGRGGMGIVYRARDPSLGRHVALKRPAPRPESESRDHSRFMREAKAAARLSHPNIVPVYDVFEENGVPWMAMELVEGASLRTILAAGPLPLKDVLLHAEELTSALQTAHAQHILHRDLKPGNVLVTPDGRARLTDFGLARLLRISDSSATRTRDSETDGQAGVGGTPRYMAPEQVLGRTLDPRSDIFSLGALLYEMCTGKPAFEGDEAEVFDAILHREPTAISRLNYEVPDELDRIVRKALAKNPEERYQDTRDLLVDVRTLRQRLHHAAYVEEHSAGFHRPPRHVVAAWGLPLAVATAVAVAGYVLWRRPASVSPPAASARARIGILMPHSGSGSKDVATWPELVQALFVRELTGIEALAVVDPLWLSGVLHNALGAADPPRGPDLYKVFQAEALAFVIDGSITPTSQGYRLQSNIVDPSTGEVRSSHDAAITSEEGLGEAVAAATRSFLAFLESEGMAVASDKDLRPWLPRGPRSPRNIEALKAFLVYSKYALRHEPGGSRYLERAIELDPTFVSPRIWRVPGLVAAGRIDEAREHHRVLQQLFLTASPFDQAMIQWVGAFLAGNRTAEVRHLERALEYAPGNNIVLVNLAESRLETGDYAGTLATLAPALRVRWRYPYLYTLQGAALLGQQRFAEAKQALHSALDVAPADAGVYGMLYAIHQRDDEPVEAERYRRLYAGRAEELGLNAAAQREQLGGYLGSVGLHGQAVEALREAIAFGTATASAHARLAEALYKAGRFPEAADAYGRVLERDPRFSEAHLMLGRIHEAEGSVQKAILDYEQFLATGGKGAAADDVRQRLERLRSTPPAAPTRR